MQLFAKDIRVPEALVTCSSKAETSAKVKRFCMRNFTYLKILEQDTLWANLTEIHIVILKSSVSKHTTESAK